MWAAQFEFEHFLCLCPSKKLHSLVIGNHWFNVKDSGLLHLHYIFAFSRHIYPKQLTTGGFTLSHMWLLRELNPGLLLLTKRANHCTIEPLDSRWDFLTWLTVTDLLQYITNKSYVDILTFICFLLIERWMFVHLYKEFSEKAQHFSPHHMIKCSLKCPNVYIKHKHINKIM